MTRALIVLAGRRERNQAHDLIERAPVNSRVEVKGPRRSTDQNSLMWELLTQLASRLRWHGSRYTADDWKDYLMHAMRPARWMPAEEGGLVPIGMRTSDLSVEEMGQLIELIYAFAARHGVELGREREVEPA